MAPAWVRLSSKLWIYYSNENGWREGRGPKRTVVSGLLGYWVLDEEEERALPQGGSSPPAAGGGVEPQKGAVGDPGRPGVGRQVKQNLLFPS